MDVPTSDEDLMLCYRAGDAAAFDTLYQRHRSGLFGYVLRQVGGNRAAAEELFQEVWMNLIRARSQYRVEAKFSTYLYTLARNRVIDHLRQYRGLHLVSLDEDADEPFELPAPAQVQPERQAEGRQQAARLLTLVESLPPAQREAFLLHEEGGLSLEEIARVTGAQAETVKSRLRYALKKLREGMEQTA